MPFNQIGFNARANLGTFNDVSGDQINVSVNEKDTLSKLKNNLNPSHMSGADRPKCLEGTRIEIQRQIFEWMENKALPNTFLLIGGAGTGKSTIATTIAEKCRMDRRLGSHLFFLRGRDDPYMVIRTLAYHLATFDASIAESMDAELLGRGDLNSTTIDSQFDILLLKPLSDAAENARFPVLIVLDALDECGITQSRERLLRVIGKKLPELPTRYRFLLTARPEEDIIEFSTLARINITEITPGDSKEDVSAYINYEFEAMRDSGKLRLPPSWPWVENMKKLSLAAEGLFIWASTVIRYVSQNPTGRYARLDGLVNSTRAMMFNDLNNLYTTVLENSLAWEKDEKDTFKGIFSLVLFGKSPLTDITINEILGLDWGKTEEFLSCLRSVVAYESGQPIRIHHTSFHDYLVSCEGKEWSINIDLVKERITARCFIVMGVSLRFNICDLKSSFLSNEQIADLNDRISERIPNSLQYTCCNWAYHLIEAPFSQVLHDKLKVLIYNHLLHWFEVLSLTNTFKEHCLRGLNYALNWLGDRDPELSTFLQDAYKQARRFLKPITQSTPHIYSSLIPLTEDESIVSRHYTKQIKHYVQVQRVGLKPQSGCRVIDANEKIFSVALSTLGDRFASGSSKGNVCVWDMDSGEMALEPLTGHLDTVFSVAFSPDGKFITSGSRDNTVRMWNAYTGNLIHSLMAHSDWVRVVSFSPDENYIVSASNDCTIKFWDVKNGQLDKSPLQGHSKAVTCISFSCDGRFLVSGSHDGTIIVWDMENRTKTDASPLIGHKSWIGSVNFLSCGDNIISTSLDGCICIWSMITGQLTSNFFCYHYLSPVALSPDGESIYASTDKDIYRIQTTTFEKPGSSRSCINFCDKKQKISGHTEAIRSIAVALDGIHFISGSLDGTIRIWRLEEETYVPEPKQLQNGITSLAVSPKGTYFAASYKNGKLLAYKMAAINKSEESCPTLFDVDYRGTIKSTTFLPNGDLVISWAAELEKVLLSSNSTKKLLLRTYTPNKDYDKEIYPVCSSPDGRFVVSGFDDWMIRIQDTTQHTTLLLQGHSGNIRAISFSPVGNEFISGADDKTVRLWCVTNGELLATLEGHTDSVLSVAYSHIGSYIASGSSDNTIRIWVAKKRTLVCEIKGHTDSVTSICFLPNELRILSGSLDKTACVWDALTGNLLFGPFGHTDGINSVSVFPDGRYFLSGGEAGLIRIWSLDDIPWHLRVEDGWIVDKENHLIAWIPRDEHKYIGLRLTGYSKTYHLNLYFNACRNGDEWLRYKCWRPV